MNRCIAITLVGLAFLWLILPAQGELVGFEFTGTFQVISDSPPFGIPPGDSVEMAGRFFYDTDSSATHDFPECGDCTGYRQQIIGGFVATFGELEVRSDDYIVTVSNDKSGLPPKDVFSVLADSSLGLSEPPLVVNGISRSAGLLEVAFNAFANLFLNSQLPTDLDLGSFFQSAVILNDSGSHTDVSIYSTIDSLNHFPIIPGDFSLDGIVDQVDYDRWKSNFGSEADHVSDGNHDGAVNAADYTIWRNHFGTHVGAGNTTFASIPEPPVLLHMFGFTLMASLSGFRCSRKSTCLAL